MLASSLQSVLWIYLLVCNALLFLLMSIDKWKAVNGRWRISEKMLLLLALIGGALGGLLAMYLWRHKTRKWYFVLTFWGVAILWVAGLIYF